MAKGKKNSFTFSRRVVTEPMPPEQWQEVQDIITRLVVRAYLADHPEVLGQSPTEQAKDEGAGDG